MTRHPLADGTTVIYTPSARLVGALLRARDLDRVSLFGALLAERGDGGQHEQAEAEQRCGGADERVVERGVDGAV